MTSFFAVLRGSLPAFALATALTFAAADTAAHERLTRIAHAYIDAIAADDPIAATALGLPGADGNLAIPSEAARAARIARLRAWKAEVDAIALGTTTLVDANDARLLRAEFDSGLNERDGGARPTSIVPGTTSSPAHEVRMTARDRQRRAVRGRPARARRARE